MHLPHALLAFAAFAAALSAQTTWIVDASNGPGTNFTEIQPAVDAASAGDVILVRPGTYAPISVSKGVAILGQPGFTVSNNAIPSPIPVVLRGLLLGFQAANWDHTRGRSRCRMWPTWCCSSPSRGRALARYASTPPNNPRVFARRSLAYAT
jgi:hypothetical protein